MKAKLIIVGAGGQGRVVYDAVMKQGVYDVIGFADDAAAIGARVIDTMNVISRCDLDSHKGQELNFVVAIGDNLVRKNKFEILVKKFKVATIVHPSATIARDVLLGDGSVVLAGAVINTGARIGKNVIINNLSLIDHDVKVGDHAHVERGSIIAAESLVADSCKTELGKAYPVKSVIQ